jgi:hypothetical protein
VIDPTDEDQVKHGLDDLSSNVHPPELPPELLAEHIALEERDQAPAPDPPPLRYYAQMAAFFSLLAAICLAATGYFAVAYAPGSFLELDDTVDVSLTGITLLAMGLCLALMLAYADAWVTYRRHHGPKSL